MKVRCYMEVLSREARHGELSEFSTWRDTLGVGGQAWEKVSQLSSRHVNLLRALVS